MGKYNIYPCETSEEALELVNRKKYNIGTLLKLPMKDFINEKLYQKNEKDSIIINEIEHRLDEMFSK